MATHPGADEGELTRRKQAIVSTGPLAQAARDLGLGEALRLGAAKLSVRTRFVQRIAD